MDTVRQLLDAKGRDVWTIAPEASVYEAIEMMADKECGALLVTTGDRIDGIVSERDYARKVILASRSSKDTRVSEIMSTDVVTATPDDTVEECLTTMTERRLRHLPVVTADGKLAGIVSIGDLVKSVIAHQRFLIGQLEQYITH